MKGDRLEQAFGNSLLFADTVCVQDRGGKPFANLCEWCSIARVVGLIRDLVSSPALRSLNTQGEGGVLNPFIHPQGLEQAFTERFLWDIKVREMTIKGFLG